MAETENEGACGASLSNAGFGANRTAIAARYTKAGKVGLMLEFAALCQEAKTKPELVAVVETLDAEFHGERIGQDWVDWREVNHLIAHRIFAYDFGEDQVPNA